MNKIIAAISHFVKHCAVFVSDTFVKVFGSDIAQNFASAAEGLIHSAIGQIVMAAVQEVQHLATGEEKYAAAFAKITTAAQGAGIIVGESIINLLIEICVQRVKGNFGPTAAPGV